MGYISITIIVLVVLDVILLAVMNRRLYRKEMEQHIVDVSVEEEQNLYTKIDEVYKESQIMRHDAKHYLTALLGLIINEEYDEARRQLIDTLGTDFKSSYIYYQNSSLINAVLNDKKNRAETSRISVDMVVSGDVPKYCEMDIAIIIANLLDNAIDASTNKDKIYVELIQDKGMYLIIVKNSISDSVIEKNPRLVSSKVDAGKLHGFGVQSIKKLVSRLDGTYQYYEEHGYFVSYVSIPCKREQSTKG